MFFQQENRSIVREKKRAKYRMVFNLDQLDWYSIYIVVSFWNDLHYAYGFMWEKKRRISLNLETFLFTDKVKPRTNYVCPSGKMQHCIYQQIAWLLNEYHRNIAVEEILFEIVCRHSFDLLFFCSIAINFVLIDSFRFATLCSSPSRKCDNIKSLGRVFFLIYVYWHRWYPISCRRTDLLHSVTSSKRDCVCPYSSRWYSRSSKPSELMMKNWSSR